DAWVGCGAPSTRQAVRLAEEAEAAGAAAIVAVPPYYLHPTLEAVERYYRALHAAVRLPLLAYNIPSLVGYALPSALVHRLGKEGVLAGAKNTAGSWDSVADYLDGAPPGFVVLPGDDVLALESITHGAPGAIMGLANIVPKLAVQLVKGARSNEPESARPLHDLIVR
ncbi:dihydrodipicolinate synthase, partial [mine drainage metagenome]